MEEGRGQEEVVSSGARLGSRRGSGSARSNKAAGGVGRTWGMGGERGLGDPVTSAEAPGTGTKKPGGNEGERRSRRRTVQRHREHVPPCRTS